MFAPPVHAGVYRQIVRARARVPTNQGRRLMRRREWSSLIVMLTVLAATACESKEENTTINADTAAVAAPEPAPAATAPAGTATTLPAGVTAEMVTQGQQIFSGKGNCFTCHGQDAKGTQLAPNLTDATWLNSDGTFEAVKQTIAVGVPTPKEHPAPMPAKGGSSITDDEVHQVAAYVYSISHAGQ
jgi:mono/diheme cytochrome c family protein